MYGCKIIKYMLVTRPVGRVFRRHPAMMIANFLRKTQSCIVPSRTWRRLEPVARIVVC